MPDLVDRTALCRNRARAHAAPDLELARAVARDIQERLQDVNRSFTAPAIVTPWPQVWRDIWPQALCVPDSEVLDLRPGAHDLVIHGLCLHWANDPLGQLIQCRHALRPDGMLIAALLGGRTLEALRASLAQAESEITGGLSPRVLPMGEIRDLGGLLHRAGLALPVADSDTHTRHFDSALALMRALRAMGEGNALAGRLRRPTRRAVLMRAAQLYTDLAPGPSGVAARFEVITLTGWAPDPSQPQALKPGSASHRLDAILRELRED